MKWEKEERNKLQWTAYAVDRRLEFAVKCVVGEWWLYSYKVDDGEDIMPPSTHKTSRAAKRQAVRNALAWLDARRKEILDVR